MECYLFLFANFAGRYHVGWAWLCGDYTLHCGTSVAAAEGMLTMGRIGLWMLVSGGTSVMTTDILLDYRCVREI
jgi:hypothetical protein